jgi:hypothetical protein
MAQQSYVAYPGAQHAVSWLTIAEKCWFGKAGLLHAARKAHSAQQQAQPSAAVLTNQQQLL